MPDGSTAFTRAGILKLNAEGQIVTSEGHRIEPAIDVPIETKQIVIEADGMVKVMLPEEQNLSRSVS